MNRREREGILAALRGSPLVGADLDLIRSREPGRNIDAVTHYLLDTNIISNATKPNPSPSLLAWMAEQADHDLFISALTIAEIRRGLLEMPAGKKRSSLEAWFSGQSGPQALFSGRVLPFDEPAALIWARLMAEGTAKGRPRSALDTIIAAIAEANGCVVVTDNEKDFIGLKFFIRFESRRAREFACQPKNIRSAFAPVKTSPYLFNPRSARRSASGETGLPMPNQSETVSRRDLLSLVGSVAGSAAMYQAMTSLGFASETNYKGPIKLGGDTKGASVLILGAGLAGMTAALELRAAGYKVQVLEFNSRPGGRNWTLRGGDSFTELGGATQTCGFEDGLYLNPGPWRIPHHHRALLDYCKRLGVALEPFVQLNHNALLHASTAFDGKPQRIRDIKTDFQGHVSELLAKTTQQGKLDEAVIDRRQGDPAAGVAVLGRARQELRLSGQSDFGGLSRLREGSRRRARCGAGCQRGRSSLSEILKSRLWRYLQNFALHRIPDHHVSAGRRHGHDRQGVRQRSRRSHSATAPR